MTTRFLRSIAAPVAFQLRTHWRSALALVTLGILAVGLLTPTRSLARRNGTPSVPALALPDIPSAGPALTWTEIARSPAETQRKSLGDLISLLSGLAWIGFGVASVSIFSCHAALARERTLDVSVRRAVGASIKKILWSLGLETVVLAGIAMLMGLALGAALLSIARSYWPGPTTALLAADPTTILALAAVLGAAGLSSLRLMSARDLVEPPHQEVGLRVPTYQVAVSVALLMGAAALLANPSHGAPGPAEVSASAELLRVDSGEVESRELSRRYGALLRSVGELPGVEQVSLTSPGTPLGLGTSDEVVTDCGQCYFGGLLIRWPRLAALGHAVSADTFLAQGIPLLSGRRFDAGDRAGAARVAIVNRHLAARYFQGGQAVGRDIFLGPGWPTTPYKIIGVVDDQRAKVIGGAIQPREAVYLSILQHPPEQAELLVRYRAGAGETRGDAVRDLVRATPASTVVRLGTIADVEASQNRAGTWLGASLGISSILVLAMALIGTLTTARMWSDSMAWEIALRRGVGASRRRMAGFVLVRTAAVGCMGGVIGLFLYLTVVAPSVVRLMPGVPLAGSGVLMRAALLPVLLALVAAAVPGLRLLSRPPSWVLR